MFGSFYDDSKTDEENKKQSDKARHNRDVILGVTAVMAMVTTAITLGFAVKKVVDEVV